MHKTCIYITTIQKPRRKHLAKEIILQILSSKIALNLIADKPDGFYAVTNDCLVHKFNIEEQTWHSISKVQALLATEVVYGTRKSSIKRRTEYALLQERVRADLTYLIVVTTLLRLPGIMYYNIRYVKSVLSYLHTWALSR